MRPIRLSIAPLMALLLASSPLLAGPDFIEDGDAGSFGFSAQPVVGVGPVHSISGVLEGAEGPDGDFEDMYLVHISDPANFSMTTRPTDGGVTEFDTQLWLFLYFVLDGGEEAGFGLLGNDDDSALDPGPSTLVSPATDLTGATIPFPGLYLLAITGKGNDPLSSLGPIFDFASATEISGPDGAGAQGQHNGWTGGGEFGSYLVELEGAEFIPEPASLSLLLVGAGVIARRRARR